MQNTEVIEKPSPYLVLARKYRPSRLADLKGQDVLVRTLGNAVKTSRIAHAFLLTGIRGVGKTTTARIIARALNCIGPDGSGQPTISPCGVCHHCIAISQDRHPDVLEMDAASRTGVNDVRELIENANYLPSSARYKIYIIDEVHMLSNSAFNALLKTLEEPPSHVKFIFATTEIRKIPVTILSRCQRFDLRRLNAQELADHLKEIAGKEGFTAEDEALALLAAAAEGSVRDGLSLLDQAIAHTPEGAGEGRGITADTVRHMLGATDKSVMFDVFGQLASGAIDEVLGLFASLYQSGVDPFLLLSDLLEICHMVTRLKASPLLSNAAGLPELERTRGKALAEQLSIGALTRLWQMLLKGLQEVQYAQNARMAAEMVLIRIAFAANLPTPARIIQDIQQGKLTDPAPLPAQKKTPELTHHVERSETSAAARDDEGENKLEIPDFTTLVALFNQHNEPLLYHHLRSDVNLVAFEEGKLTLRHHHTVPADFIKRVGACLKQWTGVHWTIILTEEEGDHSLEHVETQALERRKEKITSHADVQKVLEMFPGAEVKAVRFGDR